MMICNELIHGEKLIQSTKISQHQIVKLFSLNNGDRSSTYNLDCSNKVAEVSK